MTAPPTPQAIIMVAFDYQGSGAPFADCGMNRQAMLIARTPGITVTTLDVGAGTVTVSEVTTDRGKSTRSVTTNRTHDAVTKANYSKGLSHATRMDLRIPGHMSITDLYEEVKDIGADPETAGGLVEVSIFSHSFVDGPLLVDTNDSSPSSPGRDPKDLDARKDKDFKVPNMTSAQRAAFRAAFAPGAIWWTWGCDITSSYRQVTNRFIRSPLYLGTPPGRLNDTDRVKLSFSQDEANGFYWSDIAFFPQTMTGTSPSSAPSARSRPTSCAA
jgi:hypothetical protein